MSTFNTRLQLKNDTEANWEKAKNFVPLRGEMIAYSDLNQIKIGDGSTNVNDLPFVSSEAVEKEVFIGTEKPTNGAKIWINPNDLGEGAEPTAYALKSDLNDYQLKANAFSGSYNDLENKPTIDASITATGANAVSSKAVYDYVQQVFGQLTNGDGVRY